MKRSLLTYLAPLALLLLLNLSRADAQTCTIINNDTIICQGTTVSFSVNTTGGTPVSYSWNFGNGFTAGTASPAHTYTAPGLFIPTVTVTFAGGASCSVSGRPIQVFATPVAGFSITTDRTMCFKDNQLCVLDFSTPGVSNAPIRQRVFQLSNGHLQVDFPPYSPTICYKDSIDVLGHIFSLVMEVTDTNNCVGKFQKTDSVQLFPKFEKIDYHAEVTQFCYRTRVKFTNTSAMPQSRVAKFVWVFGDGTADSTNWLLTTHDYTGHGMYHPMLVIRDTSFCVDTVKPKVIVDVLFPDSSIRMHAPTTQCFRNDTFECESPNPVGYNFAWNVTDEDGNLVPFTLVQPHYILFSTPSCGRHKVSLTLSLGSCVIKTDSFVHVLGPKAVIESKKYTVTNAKQCYGLDTVFFVTPNPYLSCVYRNGLGLKHLWDFDDDFAPQCTVDTRKGINIGLNCNFSRDSIMVNHVYTPGLGKCYYPSLFMADTIQGCQDSARAKLALMGPDASPAPGATPPRKGLIISDTVACFGEVVTFRFDVLPPCLYSRAYINVDSACGPNNWILTDTIGNYFFTHVYQSTCSQNGLVTVGLIIANGYDLAGNICYDTSWYHHAVQLNAINPVYKLKFTSTCAPFKVTFVPDDTIQYNLVKAFWNMNAQPGVNNDTFTQIFGPNDSIVFSPSAFYPYPGIYNSYSSFTNRIGCFQTNFIRFALGYYANFSATKGAVCRYDSIELTAETFYYSANYPDDKYPVNFWSSPLRAAAGKETVWWDIGDGTGFSHTGYRVKVPFNNPGKFTIRMLVKDSLNCYDTIVKSDYVTVITPDANIAQITQKYYCAPQIVLVKDSSLVFDSVPFTVPSILDAIVSWRWDFGDYSLESFLKDAGHNYTSNGSFVVRLIATTGAGCSDTDYAQVNIAGPAPSFTIEDTVGCDPFTVFLDNTTSDALKNWTWYFGDSANQTLTTLTAADVNYTYTEPGTYYIRLLGSQDVTNPSTGNTVNCNSFFPDPVTGMPVRKVTVLPTPPVSLEVIDSACIDEKILLVSHSDSTYTQFVWKISNGDQIVLNGPDSVSSYRFDSSGIYKIALVGTQNTSGNCMGADTTEIRIMTVNAGFEIDSSASPLFRFHNTSTAATRYLWNYGKPQAGALNESTDAEGKFYFGSDTATYKVCLMAFNELDCMDSVCQNIRINQIRLFIPNVFTPDNSDGYNDAFDIDILGFSEYQLTIYNRWGAKVFEGLQDGYQNDGINWNGNDHQTGPPCAAGTYYYIFTYKFYTESKPETVHGTITLIRNR